MDRKVFLSLLLSHQRSDRSPSDLDSAVSTGANPFLARGFPFRHHVVISRERVVVEFCMNSNWFLLEELFLDERSIRFGFESSEEQLEYLASLAPRALNLLLSS